MAFGKIKVDQIESSTQVLDVDDLLAPADIGVSVQAFDDDLSALAALTTTGLINRTGAGTATIVTLPDGDVVGTTATQTLTNKTITAPAGLVKGDVGLGNVDNTADSAKPVSTDQQAALDLKANLASPTFTGTPTLPTGTIAVTQTAANNSTAVATTAYVETAVANIVDTAPAALNTLNELAAALGDDENFATTTATNLGLKAPLASPTFTGTVTAPTFAGALTGTASGNLVSGGALGTPASGTLTNCTFPTLNQSTTGNADTATTANALNTANTFQVAALGIGQAAGSGTELDLAGRYAQTSIAVAALDIDCSLGNYYTKSIGGNSTFTFSNIPASRSYSFTLCIYHTGGTITWPASVRWPLNTAPTLTTTRYHKFMFATNNGGSLFFGAVLADYTT